MDPQALRSALTKAAARAPASGALREWAALATGERTFAGQAAVDAARGRLRYLTVDTGWTCNLTCPGMCYYHANSARSAAADPAVLEQAIADADQLGLDALIFAGKEPLLDIRCLERLARFAGARPGRRFRVGTVTNGTLIERHWRTISALLEDGCLDFIDVSIDSADADQHDRIRGVPGTFRRASAGLQLLLNHPSPVRTGLTSVLRPDNAEGVLALIGGAGPAVTTYYIAPIQTPTFEGGGGLPWAHIAYFVARLQDLLAGPRQGAGLEVSVSLLGLHLADAIAAGVVDLAAVEEDALGQIYLSREIGGNRLLILIEALPETGRHGLRILPSGIVLPSTHYLQSADPAAHAVGDLTRESLTQAQSRAVGPGGPLAKLWASRTEHACSARPCWTLCFGGIAVADHALVAGEPLDQQPQLCSRSNADFAVEGG